MLVLILANHTDKNQFSFFKLISDLVIDGRLNLNFICKDFGEKPFLFVAIKFFPQKQFFEYFINNGAKINFSNSKSVEPETCLDFIKKIIKDTLLDDLSDGYYYKVKKNYNSIHKNMVCVDKLDYEQLLLHSELIYQLRDFTILENYVNAIGGKTYQELQNK